MTRSSHSYVTVAVFLMCHVLSQVEAQQCKSEYSIYGAKLKGHVFEEKKTANFLSCVERCNSNLRCQSVNYVISQYVCELNRRTKEARPEDFVPDTDRIYVTRLSGRVPLGSIPDLPAASCLEIKAGEGDNAVSGNYWLDSVKPGQSVLAPCNMLTGDVDECNASVPLCDANANCQNTAGSFICSCKSGFNGDGFNCADIDECASGSHNCVSGTATCSNTAGSYNCMCKPGYFGDGQKSCAPIECVNYQNLTSADRRITHIHLLPLCDNALGPAWFRFQGNAGTKMPTSCTPANRCGTGATGWLQDPHPTVQEGKVTKRVCFSWLSNCCTWSINIQVLNCSGYYLYFINGTPREHPCHLRYCGTD